MITKTPARVTPAPAELATWTPAQIDDRLADIWSERYAAEDAESSARRRISAAEKNPTAYGFADAAERATAKLAEALARLDELSLEAEPYEARWKAERWQRYFLVVNTGGHVHTSMSCSTCYPTTRYAWLTQLSGKSEQECVAEVGETACTVCMPSAPVFKGFGDGTSTWARKTQAEKDAADAEKAVKAAAKAAKAITDVDGSPLRIDGWVIATVVSAWKALVDGLDYGTSPSDNQPWRDKNLAEADHAADALAAKLGRTAGDVLAEGHKKLAARRKRDGR